jgi:chemotaxis methyl-accepting protein methylase
MLSDDEFRRLLIEFDRPWAGYRKVRRGVKKRLRRHMVQIGCKTIDDYLRRLDSQPTEKAVCEACLLVTISRFFRDRQLWQDLQDRLLPELVRGFEDPLRIWTAGCAGGEEAYSLAIIWEEMARPATLELLATDIQAECLRRAREGVYGLSSLKELPQELRSVYFSSRKGGRQFSIKTRHLIPIGWQQHDLLHPPPPGRFHMILLRNNLLTYHRGPRLRSSLERILSVLAPGGYLVVGSHEKPAGTAYRIERDDACPWVYRRHA